MDEGKRVRDRGEIPWGAGDWWQKMCRRWSPLLSNPARSSTENPEGIKGCSDWLNNWFSLLLVLLLCSTPAWSSKHWYMILSGLSTINHNTPACTSSFSFRVSGSSPVVQQLRQNIWQMVIQPLLKVMSLTIGGIQYRSLYSFPDELCLLDISGDVSDVIASYTSVCSHCTCTWFCK